MRALKGRYRLDAALERLSTSRMNPQLVPIVMVTDLEDSMREQDETLRQVKQESYRTHVRICIQYTYTNIAIQCSVYNSTVAIAVL